MALANSLNVLVAKLCKSARRVAIIAAVVAAMMPGLAQAAAQLQVEIVSYNVIGLDHNDVNAGPNRYPAAVRVRNIGDAPAINVAATFNWTSANANINLAGPAVITEPSIPAGGFEDFYFNVQVTRTAAAYATQRQFQVTATATGIPSATSPANRAIRVEQMLSQSRNSIVSLSGPDTVTVGQTYTYTLVTNTSSQRDQLVTFIEFPNIIFRIRSVSALYTSENPDYIADRTYVNACGAQPDITSPQYLNCGQIPGDVPDGKVGGNIVTTFEVQILSAGSADVNAVIYDKDGGQWHYNNDYGNGMVITAVEPGADVAVTKTASDSDVLVGDTFDYEIGVRNNGPLTAADASVTDVLPAGVSYVSHVVTSGTLTESPVGTLNWAIGTLAVDAGATATITVLATTAGSKSNSATVTGGSPDDIPGNNTTPPVITTVEEDCNNNDIPDSTEPDCNGNDIPDDCDITNDPTLDCDNNGLIDSCEIADDPTLDCDNNGILDSCELAGNDCNENGQLDVCDIATTPSLDCDVDGIIDSCEIAGDPGLDCDNNGILDSCELAGNDCNENGQLDVCDIATTPSLDCDVDGIIDSCEIAGDPGLDCDNNGILDSCELAGNDCNENGQLDVCDIATTPSLDCDVDGIIDSCEIAGDPGLDCDNNGILDSCELAGNDCNENGQLDVCDIATTPSLDCDVDGIIDSCEIAGDPGLDCDNNGILDSCELAGNDCNENGQLDVCDIATTPSLDCDVDGIIDSCEIAGDPGLDCDENGVLDSCELAGNDCNENGQLDVCDIATTPSLDCDVDGIIDSCEIAGDPGLDCDNNGILDSCELAGNDCNENGQLDVCDIATTPSLDCNGNAILDSCELLLDPSLDCNLNGVIDTCELAGNDCNDNGILDSCDLVTSPSLDCNGNGFIDSCEVLVDTDRTYQNLSNQAINDRAEPEDSTILVTGIAAALSNVKLSMFIDHPETGQLTVQLIGPDGTSVTLVNATGCIGNCGPGEGNFGTDCVPSDNDTTFDDNATSSITEGVNPFVGTWIPQEPLSLFDGKSGAEVNGIWTLRVIDNVQGRAGQIRCWSLSLSTGQAGSNDCNENGIPDDCEADCNENGSPDDCDIATTPSLDCDNSGTLDSCDIATTPSLDCDNNGVIDSCELAGNDCNENGQLDVCDIATTPSLDCDGNGSIDSCEIAGDPGLDCDSNGVLDSCELAGNDCNENGQLDVCDIATTPSLDCDSNGVIDSCELEGRDCNNNQVLDSCEIADDPSIDCNSNQQIDTCEIADDPSIDCDSNGVIDSCELDGNDCNGNQILDVCDIANDPSIDCDTNGVIDSCELEGRDCNNNQILDSCEIAEDPSIDCNSNQQIDSCELADDPSIDCDSNGVIDSCELEGNDCNENQVLDSCEIADDPSLDCNENQVLDECELAEGATDDNNDNILDECQPANLSVNVTATPSPGSVNYQLTYHIQVCNNGPNAATSVVLTNVLPDTVAHLTSVPDQGSCSIEGDTTVTCELGNMASSACTSVTISVIPLQAGVISDTASVDAIEPDPDTNDNTDTELTTILPLGCYESNTFDTDETQPAGATGWTASGATLTPGLVEADYDEVQGAYRLRTYSNSSRYRIAGWLNNAANWMPYSGIGSNGYVRAKFYMYAQGAPTFENFRQVPNFTVRLANRFAVSHMLAVYSHDIYDPGSINVARELRPSSDPENPSIYRLDMDPIDVPYLQTATTTEGIMSGFEIYTVDPTDHGYIGMTEIQLGCYQAETLADNLALETKIYEPSEVDAGTLKVFSSFSDIRGWNFVSPPPASPIGTYYSIETTNSAQYSESPAGITIDSSNVPGDKIAYLERYIYPGPFTGRMRVEENRIYKARWHITSTIPTTEQSWIWLRTRSSKFSYSQWMQLGGANATNGASNRALTRQTLPGIGCENPDKIGSENGGWYTQIFNTPLDIDIRPEFPANTPLATRMPNFTAEPGTGANSLSLKDIKHDVVIYDSLSAGTGMQNEKAHFTVDKLELRSYTRQPD